MLNKFFNTVFLPIRLLFSHETVNRLGLYSMRDERCDFLMKHCKGRLLDIGCGNNQLVKKYGHNSIGVDVYDFSGDALIIKDSSNLPFEDKSFETVSFVASLNHIPDRKGALRETHRILCSKGKVLITMLNPFIGKIRHELAWWDPDQHQRKIKDGEAMGLSHEYLLKLMDKSGFNYIARKKFILGLNSLYIFEKRD